MGAAASSEVLDSEALRVAGYPDGDVGDACWGLERPCTPRPRTAGIATAGDEAVADQPRTRLQGCRLDRRGRELIQVDSASWHLGAAHRVGGAAGNGHRGASGAEQDGHLGDLGAPDEPVQVEPGHSWSDAPDISSGTHAFHLAPGTVAVFRMRLDWGQHGQVLISSKDRLGDSDAMATYWAGPQAGAITRPDLQNAPPDADVPAST